MKLVVYGDIHGCLDELKLLRKKIDIQKGDIEVTVGDILNKGPHSLKTLRYIKKKQILSVLGNNELKVLRLYKIYKKDKSILEDIKPWEVQILKNLKKRDKKFLKSLPYFLKFDNITILHGGLPLGVNLKQKLTKQEKEQITLLRYYDKNKNPLQWHEKDKRDKFWSELYDGRDGFIVHGHHPFEKPFITKNAIDIDTGCVYGRELTAIVFEKLGNSYDTSNYKFYFQKALKDYFK